MRAAKASLLPLTLSRAPIRRPAKIGRPTSNFDGSAKLSLTPFPLKRPFTPDPCSSNSDAQPRGSEPQSSYSHGHPKNPAKGVVLPRQRWRARPPPARPAHRWLYWTPSSVICSPPHDRRPRNHLDPLHAIRARTAPPYRPHAARPAGPAAPQNCRRRPASPSRPILKTLSVKVFISLTRVLEKWPNPRSRISMDEGLSANGDLRRSHSHDSDGGVEQRPDVLVVDAFVDRVLRA